MTKLLFLIMLLVLVSCFILIATKHYYLVCVFGAAIYLIWCIWAGRFINKGWK